MLLQCGSQVGNFLKQIIYHNSWGSVPFHVMVVCVGNIERGMFWNRSRCDRYLDFPLSGFHTGHLVSYINHPTDLN
jgi:hypothetical protein